jgi:hypothetical protein
MKSPSIAFTPETDIAPWLESYCSLTGLDPSQALNALVRPHLEQICQDGDSTLLLVHLRQREYPEQNQALELIERFKGFCREHNGSVVKGAYDPELRLRRTPDGNWEIVFRSTHPNDKDAIYG